VFFAMHVAGFHVAGNADLTGQFVGGAGTGVPPPGPPSGGGEVQPTPEPSTVLLACVGFGALVLAGVRRRYGFSSDFAS
jgi:hypothetical protein